MEQIYDMIIIGGGPAGYTAALYAARAGLSTLVLEKLSAGGQMALTEQIDNYPGFESGIDGFTLGEKMQQSAERFGAVTELAEVYKASLSGKIKTLDTSEGVFQSSTVVIATGASPRPLGVPGEEALIGKGVHYCAACDGAPYRGKTVAVVGGGNSAATDALTLSRIAQKVYLIHRRDSLRASKVYHAPLMAAPNVEFCWNSTVSALLHENRLTGLRLQDVNTGAERELACDGVFISVGRAPATELFRSELALDKSGYIIADESTRTSIPGVFRPQMIDNELYVDGGVKNLIPTCPIPELAGYDSLYLLLSPESKAPHAENSTGFLFNTELKSLSSLMDREITQIYEDGWDRIKNVTVIRPPIPKEAGGCSLVAELLEWSPNNCMIDHAYRFTTQLLKEKEGKA